MSLLPAASSGKANYRPKSFPPLPSEELEDILRQTRSLWEEVRGQEIFMTGGTGFFGVWLLESFAHANERLGLGARVMVLTRNPQAFCEKVPHLAGHQAIELLPGSLPDFKFPAGRYPFVVHAANETVDAGTGPRQALDSILHATDHLLDFAAQAGTTKLLLTSSGAAYGRQPPGLAHLAEEYPGDPGPLTAGSVYGAGKRAMEASCIARAAAAGYEAKIARCFAFIGPHLPLDGDFAAGNFIHNALRRKPIRVNGDGTPHRSYLYAADLVVWLWTILFRGQSGRAYNVGSAQSVTIAQLAQKVAAESGQSVVIGEAPVPGAEAARYVPAVDRARDELSLVPKITLESAIQRTLRWYRPLFQ